MIKEIFHLKVKITIKGEKKITFPENTYFYHLMGSQKTLGKQSIINRLCGCCPE